VFFERQLHIANGSVTVFGNDNFGHPINELPASSSVIP
jgi:hypothetical protein